MIDGLERPIADIKVASSLAKPVSLSRVTSEAYRVNRAMNTKTNLWVLIVTCAAVTITEANPILPNPCQGITGVRNVPNPEDCTRFYVCVNEQAFPGQCAPELIFDVLTMACNRAIDSICIVDLVPPPTPGPARDSPEEVMAYQRV